ncbi:hypothetical protein ES703_93839 [subsurface metagenome]
MLWSGTLASIPDGWHLCDGTHGTPDMRDQFSLSAGPVFPRGTSLDLQNHPHDFTSDLHAHLLLAPPVDLAIPGPHDRQTTPSATTGTTDLTNAPPPYYSLAYVMRLPD